MSNDPTNLLLTKMLDLSAMRHRVLAHNLANVNTPGYRRQDLPFVDVLGDAVRQGPEALQAFLPEATEDPSAPLRADGNSVQFDQELSEMSKNALLYQMALQLMQERSAMLRGAITGRF